MKFLITGATGKVGQHLIERIMSSAEFSAAEIVALCHNRVLSEHARLKIVRGSVADPDVAARALDGVTHVFHLATVKESPDAFIDVSIKGLFNLLEASRNSVTLQQFILTGGDAAVGHCFVKYDTPVTESSPRHAYPGVYAFSKVLEEVMVEQYRDQYGLPMTILRAPWIMEKDDFRYALSFGPDQFGGPSWDTLIRSEMRAQFASENRVPLLLDVDGRPLLRNFIHVSDLVEALVAAAGNQLALGEIFNVAMTDPVDYGAVAEILQRERGMQPAIISTPFYSNVLCNSKARQILRWRQRFGLEELVSAAFEFDRSNDEPRRVWYPG